MIDDDDFGSVVVVFVVVVVLFLVVIVVVVVVVIAWEYAGEDTQDNDARNPLRTSRPLTAGRAARAWSRRNHLATARAFLGCPSITMASRPHYFL
jgi:hypothetical protein